MQDKCARSRTLLLKSRSLFVCGQNRLSIYDEAILPKRTSVFEHESQSQRVKRRKRTRERIADHYVTRTFIATKIHRVCRLDRIGQEILKCQIKIALKIEDWNLTNRDRKILAPFLISFQISLF